MITVFVSRTRLKVIQILRELCPFLLKGKVLLMGEGAQCLLVLRLLSAPLAGCLRMLPQNDCYTGWGFTVALG